MSLSQKNQILWPVYIIIENLDAKILQSQKRSRMLFLRFILIIYKRLKGANNKDKDLKAKIYHIVLKFML